MDLLGLADMSGGIAPFPFLLAAACGSKLQGGDSLGSPLRDAARAGLLLACNTRFWLCGLSVTTALALGIHGGAGVASPSAGEARSSPPPSLSISLESRQLGNHEGTALITHQIWCCRSNLRPWLLSPIGTMELAMR